MPNTWLSSLNVDWCSTLLPYRGKQIWLKWNSRRGTGSWDIESVLCCFLETGNLDWKVPVLKLEAFVCPSFSFYGWLCWANEAVVASLCGTRSGSDGRLPTSHQTFSQSFSSTGQPRGPLEPPQIVKPWSLSCLRPAPPLRPSAALGYKEVILLHTVYNATDKLIL